MLLGYSMAKATVVEINGGVSSQTSDALPTKPYYDYSLTQQIYTAEELNFYWGYISSLGFFNTGSEKTRNIDIYLVTVDKQAFAPTEEGSTSSTDWVSFTDADKVFSGEVTFASGAWTNIEFDTMFDYDGDEDLCVIVNDHTGSYQSGAAFNVYSAQGQAIRAYRDASNYDLENLSETTGTIQNVKNTLMINEAVLVADNITPFVPAKVNSSYSVSMQIYTKEEINKAGNITSISFVNESVNACERVIDIVLVPTSKTSFDSEYDGDLNISDGSKVFDGSVTFAPGTSTTITFDTPYEYNGTDNLIVIVSDRTGSNESATYSWCWRGFDAEQQAIYAESDMSAFTPYSSNQSWTFSSKKNCVRFNIVPATSGNEIYIGDEGTATNSYLPTTGMYNYSVSQQIYTADEVGAAKDITSISYYNTGAELTRNLDIYLANVDKASFESKTDWISFSESDKVFSGEVTFAVNEWTPIGFNKAFSFNGTDNLAVIVVDKTGTWKSSMKFYSYEVAEAQAIYVYNDNSAYDAEGLGEAKATTTSKNQIYLNEVGLDIRPTGLSVDDITYNSAVVTWESEGSLWNLEYKEESDEEWTSVPGLTSKTYSLTGLEEQTTYDVRVQVVFGEGGVSNWAQTSFETPEKYPTPTDFAILDVHAHSVMLGWTENGTATAWEIYLNGEVISAPTNPYTLAPLEANTEYEVYVRSVYGDETSNWSNGGTFTTPVANQTPYDIAADVTPNAATITWKGNSDSYQLLYRKVADLSSADFFEDFDGITDGQLPEGWTTIDADGDGYTWVPGSATGAIYLVEGGSLAGKGHNGSQDLMTSGSFTNAENKALEPDNYLVSPQVTLGGVLTFYACAQDGSYPNEHFGVAVSTTGNTDAEDFTTIAEWTLNADGSGSMSSRRKAQGAWGMFQVDLSAYAGQQGYIAIRHFNCTDMFLLNIDDFGIYGAESGLELEPWNYVNADEDKNVTLYGLEPDTKYEYMLTGYMEDEDDASTGIMYFTTLPNNPVPFDIVVDPAPTSVDMRWTGYGDTYQIWYRTAAPEAATFFDDFEEGLDNWTIYTDGEAPQENGWFTYDVESSAPSGTLVASAWSYYNSTKYNADNWLVTPQVDLGGTLRFLERSISGSWPDSYEVLLSTGTNAEEDFTTTLREMQAAPASWNEVEIDLSDYEGQQGYIAIHHVSYDEYGLYIDDFGIYQPTGAPGAWYSWATGENNLTISGLQKNTKYEYYISSMKEGEADADTELATFTTTGDAVEIALDVTSDDNSSILSENDGAYANVTVNGEIAVPANTWFALCLPFDMDVEASPFSGADVRTIDGVWAEGTCVILDCLTPVTRFQAGTPYVASFPNGAYLQNPVFNGVIIKNTYNNVSLSGDAVEIGGRYDAITYDGAYPNYYTAIGSPTLKNLEGGDFFRAFDCWFYFSDDVLNNYETFILNTGGMDDIITGVASPFEGIADDAVIYNLAGQRISKVQKGINIVNGKKVLVK